MVGLEGMAAGIAVVHCTSNIRANTWKMYGTNSVGGGVGGGDGGVVVVRVVVWVVVRVVGAIA